MLGTSPLEQKQEDKYLGYIMSSHGLTDSVEATGSERTAKVKGSLYELQAVIEDVRMQALGGFGAAIDL